MATAPPSVGWEEVAGRLKVVRLSAPVLAAAPLLALSALPKRTRGFALYPGRMGGALGAVLAVGAALVGWLLGGAYGLVGAALAFWLLGTYGVAMALGSLLPAAFVKPICTRCRLLPIIKEHESMHLCGVAGEADVWASMRTRHTVESLGLEGDPAICSFCPIPKRLSEG